MRIKVDRDLILLPNVRHRVVALISIHLKLSMRCLDQEFWFKVDPKLPFLGKNREIGKNMEIKKKEREKAI